MATQLEKAHTFKALHEQDRPFLLPNPWDAGTTRILEAIGFEALATTSLGLANMLGRSDGTRAVTADDVLENCRVIASATDLPINADLENCYADAPQDAADMIRRAADAGVVGGSIEDTTGNRDTPIYEFTLSVERVQAAVEVARALPFPFMLTARAENHLHGRHDLDDTIKRLQAFEAAGADVLYAPGLRDLETISTVVSAVNKPVNIVMGMADPDITLDQLAAAGVRRVSVGGALSRIALAAVMKAAREMQQDGGFTFIRDMVPYPELREMFDREG